MTMLEKSLLGLSPAGFHRIAYTEWDALSAEGSASPAARTVVCVHGLTRNSRDFDRLAAVVSAEARVVCPDVVGRGHSDWLSNPDFYGYPQYLADMTALIARLDAETVDWVGTSMGGLIGMFLAAQPKSPIRRLILNDVGPFVPRAALERIGDYVGADPLFEDLKAVESYLRFIYCGFGRLTAEEWWHLAEHSVRRRPDGRYGFAYDPGIGKPFKDQPSVDVYLWAVWDAVCCPVLILRGADSDLLLPETVRRMRERSAATEVVEIDYAGHAPALMAEDQIAVIRDFLFGDG